MPTRTSDSTSPSLLARAREQDPAAWQRLSDLYAPLVYRWARQAGLQASDAADVGQEVFQVVARRLALFRNEGPGDSFRGWLCGITKNKVREFQRRRATQAHATGGTTAMERFQELSSSLPDDAEQHDDTTRSLLMRRALDTIRAEFEDSTWRAFWRTTIDERPSVEVASELNLSSAAVRQAKYRVFRRLRTEVEGLL